MDDSGILNYAMLMIDHNEMGSAMRANNADYNGKFFVGVHSTGIYCLPSCPARLPLLKNVLFYNSREDAIAAGLRGCKRCHSERFPDVLPDWLYPLLEYMRENLKERLDEKKLMKIAGVNISTIRRHFKEELKSTPASFHRRQRLAEARHMIETGSDYLSAAYECGWESSSGFRQAFEKQFGYPPGRRYERI